MRWTRLRRRSMMSAVSVAVAAICVACGGGSNSSGSNKQAPSAFSGGGAVTVPTFGKKVPLAPKKVGILDVNASDPAAALLESSAQSALSTVGWSNVAVDAGGDPSKMAAGMNQLLAQKVDAIVLDAVDPAQLTAGLKKAKAANVPVVLYGGAGSPSDLISTSIVPDDYTLAALASDFLINSMNGKGEVAIMTTDGISWAGHRTTQLRAQLKEHPGIKVVGVHQVDFANFQTDLLSATRSMLQAHPKLSTIFATVSAYPSPIATALRQAGATKKVKVVSFYAYPSELDLIRKGQLLGVADTSFPQNSYQAVDVLAQYFGKHTPFSSAEAYKLPLQYQLVTRDNAPPAGQTVKTSINFVGYYNKLWANEFAKGK